MQALNMKMAGLFTHPNPFSEAPLGALVKAKNMVVDKEGVVETRRGLKKYGTLLTLAGSEKINAILNYKDALIVHYASKLARDSDGLGTWTDYSGTFVAPTNAVAIRGLEANKNFYFTTSAGVKKLDSISGTPGSAGMYKGLDGTATSTGATGFLADNNQVAYRVVWGITDANNNLVLGAPSQRFLGLNVGSGTTKDMSLVITIPDGVTTSHFFQVYRSVASGGATTVPNDELALVYEANPTAGQITAKSITFTDSVVESLRGTLLYTNPSQQGISQSNDIPPLCQDMAFYKNQTFFANTISKQRRIITLISVGGTIGIQANDTLTIGGIVFTAKAVEAAASGEFKVSTAGTPAENIDATALSLCRVINQYASNTQFYAYYLSGYTDLPGKILIEERGIGGATMPLISSRGAAYNPALPTSGTTISTSSDTSLNGLYVSKNQQPEAVPIANKLSIGSADKAILRVIALRDSVFIFKEDGVFRITGETLSNFQVALFDVTVILKAPESAVPFSNQIFAYTSQGVVAISDTGSAIMSRPIEVDLLPIATFTNFSTITYAVAYESDRKYVLFMQRIATDSVAKQAWVYNALSNAWTRWEMTRGCGIINSNDDKLYLGSADSGYIYQERKDFAVTDYADDEFPITIVSSSGVTVTVDSTANLAEGQTLVQGGRSSAIASVVDATTITVADTLTWTAAAATAYNPIDVEMETIQQTAGNPGILKHYRDVTIFFRRAKFKSMSFGVKTNISPTIELTSIATPTGAGWGSFPFGSLPWGGKNQDYQTIRTYVARNKQRAHWLSIVLRHSEAREFFAIAGLSLQFDQMSEKTR